MINFANYLPKDQTKRMYTVIGIVVGCVLILGLIGWGIWYAVKHKGQVTASITNQLLEVIPENGATAEESSVAARHLDGMLVSTDEANTWPVCLMVENAAFDGVRPQSGLSQASVVYEVIVEGGITRLLAVYGGEAVTKIGPVRSARDTYIEFVSEMDCLYGYAGGSFTAAQATQSLALKTLNALSSDGRFFWRDKNIFAPHNLFTSSDLITLALRDKQLDTREPSYETWTFRDQPEEGSPEARQATLITLDFSTPAYQVRWEYKEEAGYYERYNGGVLHTDKENGQALTTRNIIVQMVPPGEYIEGKGRINFSVTGEGKVLVFRSGEVVEGTWKKADRVSRTQFFDAAGQPIELNRGNTWVEILPTDRSVTY
ncbi:MAG: DUF3048 domain-containing protein [Patescibacteria group bacterium]